MRFYHYTRREYLPSILKHGLDSGELCVSLQHHVNAVWLTTSPSPQGHGLMIGRGAAKLEYRIEVDIDRGDQHLRRYRQWTRQVGLDPAFLKHMRRAAGQGADDYSWYVYFGTIRPPFVAISDMLTGQIITPSPSDAPPIRGETPPGSTLVSVADVEAGKIDLAFDPAGHVGRQMKMQAWLNRRGSA